MDTQNTTPGMNGNGAPASVQEGVDQAGSTAHDTISRISAAARPAVDRIAAGAHQAVDKLAGVASQAAESLGTKGGQLKTTQERMMDEARVYVRNKPATAIGIAVAAGFILSKMMRSR